MRRRKACKKLGQATTKDRACRSNLHHPLLAAFDLANLLQAAFILVERVAGPSPENFTDGREADLAAGAADQFGPAFAVKVSIGLEWEL